MRTKNKKFFDEKSNKRDVLKANIQNFNDQPKAKAKAKQIGKFTVKKKTI